MIRAFVVAATVYSAGAPQMADYRPDFLDVPLQNFHKDINLTVKDVVHAAYQFDAAHPMHRVKPYLDFSRRILEETGYPADHPERRTENDTRADWKMLQATLSE
ncbi:MAG: hypothetical protein R3D02_00300 [Hyphomicrobiales bacterium]